MALGSLVQGYLGDLRATLGTNVAHARTLFVPAVERDRRDAEDLAQARVELENIASAIRLGIVTPTTKAMLEDAERRITPFEAGLHAHGPPRFR